MDQIWHRPNLVGPNMAPTKFGWTKNGSDQIWVWTKYGLDQIWARPNMLDQIWSDQKWPTKSVSTKSGLTPYAHFGIYLKQCDMNVLSTAMSFLDKFSSIRSCSKDVESCFWSFSHEKVFRDFLYLELNFPSASFLHPPALLLPSSLMLLVLKSWEEKKYLDSIFKFG